VALVHDNGRGHPDGTAPDPDDGQEVQDQGSEYATYAAANPWAADDAHLDDEPAQDDGPGLVLDEMKARFAEHLAEQAQDDRPSLSRERRADLHRSGITDKTIDRLGIQDARNVVGWAMPWSDLQDIDGDPGFLLEIPDRDKRPADGRKVLWPKGQTSYPACVRLHDDPALDIFVEGPRQALAVASYAPDDARVWCLNGADGIHAKIRRRLGYVAGRRAALVLDGDWRRNDHIGRAATERAPAVLADAGAAEILFADVGGIGRDSIDDILGRTMENERGPLLAQLLDHARPAADRRLELETDRQRIRLQATDEARRQIQAQAAGQLPAPAMTSLADLLDEPDDDAAVYRVDKLWPTGGNVILAAQRKAGKTTLTGNLIRSLNGGDPFLAPPGRFAHADRAGFPVEPVDGTVALLDFELAVVPTRVIDS
jgi:hypothetical protein